MVCVHKISVSVGVEKVLIKKSILTMTPWAGYLETDALIPSSYCMSFIFIYFTFSSPYVLGTTMY